MCRDAYLDLADAGLDWAQYLKIVDVTNTNRFGPWADGYDLDGVLVRQIGSTGGRLDEEIQLVNQVLDEEIPFMVEAYPNPVSNTLKANLSTSTASSAQWQIIDQAGRVMESKLLHLNPGMNAIQIEVDYLDAGLYHLIVKTDKEKTAVKFVKK